MRSRSTTSGGPPGSAIAAPTSTTRPTSRRRRTRGLRADIEAAAAHLRAVAGTTQPVHDRLLHGRPDGVPHGGVRARARGRDRLLRLADRGRRATTRPRRRTSRRRSTRRSSRSSAAPTRASTRRFAPPGSGADQAAGVDHETIVYEGAPHSFFDRKADEFADQSAAAWAATLGFIRARTASRVSFLKRLLGGAPAEDAAPERTPAELLADEQERDRELLLAEAEAHGRRPDPAPAPLRGPLVDATRAGRHRRSGRRGRVRGVAVSA